GTRYRRGERARRTRLTGSRYARRPRGLVARADPARNVFLEGVQLEWFGDHRQPERVQLTLLAIAERDIASDEDDAARERGLVVFHPAEEVEPALSAEPHVHE